MRGLVEVRYLDRTGQLQMMEIRTTRTTAEVRALADELQGLVGQLLTVTGAELLSVQLIDQVPSSA
jgi:hypothetical protein